MHATTQPTKRDLGSMVLSLGSAVIARSVSDETILTEAKDCFVPLAMTFQLNCPDCWLSILWLALSEDRDTYASTSSYLCEWQAGVRGVFL